MTKGNNFDKNNNIKRLLENQHRSIEDVTKIRKQITLDDDSKNSIQNALKGISRFDEMNIENPLMKNLSAIESMKSTFKQMEKINISSISAVENALKGISRFDEMNIGNPLMKNLSAIESMKSTFKQMEKINISSISAVENALKGISRFDEMNIENPLMKNLSAISESIKILRKTCELSKGLELTQYKDSLLYVSEVLEQSSLDDELLREDSVDISEIESILCDNSLSIQEKIVEIFKRYINKNIIIFMLIYYLVISPLYGVYCDYVKASISSAIENISINNYTLDGNTFNKSIKKEASKAISEYSNSYSDEIVILNNYRFVNCDSLNVRYKNTVNSAVIYSLNRGDIVKIINKQKNWTKIEYKSKDETVSITGWVFTRYISRFN